MSLTQEICVHLSCNTHPVIQGDQNVSMHLMIYNKIVRCTETFWSPCTWVKCL